MACLKELGQQSEEDATAARQSWYGRASTFLHAHGGHHWWCEHGEVARGLAEVLRCGLETQSAWFVPHGGVRHLLPRLMHCHYHACMLSHQRRMLRVSCQYKQWPAAGGRASQSCSGCGRRCRDSWRSAARASTPTTPPRWRWDPCAIQCALEDCTVTCTAIKVPFT